MIKGHSYSPHVRACCEGRRITYLLNDREVISIDYPFEPIKDGWPDSEYLMRLEVETIRGWADRLEMVAEALENALDDPDEKIDEKPIQCVNARIEVEVSPGKYIPIETLAQISELRDTLQNVIEAGRKLRNSHSQISEPQR